MGMKLTFAALAFGALALAGCVTAAETQAKIDATQKTIQSVQDWTKFACAFVPTVGTITGLINAGAGATISGVGGAICNAIATAPLADGPGAVVRVGAVKVHGTYVNSGRKI